MLLLVSACSLLVFTNCAIAISTQNQYQLICSSCNNGGRSKSPKPLINVRCKISSLTCKCNKQPCNYGRNVTLSYCDVTAFYTNTDALEQFEKCCRALGCMHMQVDGFPVTGRSTFPLVFRDILYPGIYKNAKGRRVSVKSKVNRKEYCKKLDTSYSLTSYLNVGPVKRKNPTTRKRSQKVVKTKSPRMQSVNVRARPTAPKKKSVASRKTASSAKHVKRKPATRSKKQTSSRRKFTNRKIIARKRQSASAARPGATVRYKQRLPNKRPMVTRRTTRSINRGFDKPQRGSRCKGSRQCDFYGPPFLCSISLESKILCSNCTQDPRQNPQPSSPVKADVFATRLPDLNITIYCNYTPVICQGPGSPRGTNVGSYLQYCKSVHITEARITEWRESCLRVGCSYPQAFEPKSRKCTVLFLNEKVYPGVTNFTFNDITSVEPLKVGVAGPNPDTLTGSKYCTQTRFHTTYVPESDWDKEWVPKYIRVRYCAQPPIKDPIVEGGLSTTIKATTMPTTRTTTTRTTAMTALITTLLKKTTTTKPVTSRRRIELATAGALEERVTTRAELKLICTKCRSGTQYLDFYQKDGFYVSIGCKPKYLVCQCIHKYWTNQYGGVCSNYTSDELADLDTVGQDGKSSKLKTQYIRMCALPDIFDEAYMDETGGGSWRAACVDGFTGRNPDKKPQCKHPEVIDRNGSMFLLYSPKSGKIFPGHTGSSLLRKEWPMEPKDLCSNEIAPYGFFGYNGVMCGYPDLC